MAIKKITYIMAHRFYFCLYLVVALFVTSCATSTYLTVRQPSLTPLNVSSLAIAPFQVVTIKRSNLVEKEGKWTQQEQAVSLASQQVIAKQIRGSVVQALSNTPHLHLFYSDNLEQWNTDSNLSPFISAAGVKEKRFDAILQGRIWIESEERSSADVRKDTLSYRRVYYVNPRRVISFDVDKVGWWPYKSSNVTLTIELKVIRLSPTTISTDFMSSKSMSYWIGSTPLSGKDKAIEYARAFSQVKNYLNGGDENQDRIWQHKLQRSDDVLPTMEEALALLARDLGNAFAKQVGYSLERKQIQLDTSGDSSGILLIRKGAYQSAVERLEQVLAKKQTAADMYNLGVALEATASFALAKSYYTDAFNQSPTGLYASGIGRIERIFRLYKNIGSMSNYRVQ